MKTETEMTLEKWRPRMIALAHTIKSWSSCVEGKQHGCVLAIDGKYIVSTGFNGVHRLRQFPNCVASAELDYKCEIKRDGCEINPKKCDAIHAEVNAVINAARVGANLARCWAYMTKQPCKPCRSVLINAGLKVIAWEEAFSGAALPQKDGTEIFE